MASEIPAWAAALGRVPSGLFIVTLGGAAETGMLASWVQQCSFEPPQLTVAVRKGRPVLDTLLPGVPFAVNVVPEPAKPFLVHFGKGFEPGQSAFVGQEIARTEHGVPVLTQALAHVECTVVRQIDVGDHVLILGHVDGGAVHHDGKPSTHVRKNGLGY